MATLPTEVTASMGYLLDFLAGPSRTIRVLSYVNAAASAAICLLFLAGFALRMSRGNLKWIQPDGALTRPDFQVVIPAIWCLLAAGFVPVHCLVASLKTVQATWAIFIASFYLTQSSICLAANIICLAWISRVPSVRKYVEQKAASRRASGKSFSPMRVYIALVLLLAILFFASTLPQTVKSYLSMNQAFALLYKVLGMYEKYAVDPDPALLSQMLTSAQQLKTTADFVMQILLKYITGFFTLWALVWSLTIITSGVLLRKSVEVCIASLPAVPDYLTRPPVYKANSHRSLPPLPASAALQPSHNLENQQARQNEEDTQVHLPSLHKIPSYPALPEDRPFANVMARNKTTLHPRHFQVIMDAPTISPSEKTRQLRMMLRRDAYLSGLFLLVLLLSVGDAIFVACGVFTITAGPGSMPPQTALLIYYAWGSYAFLVPALPGAINFLFSSIRASPARDPRALSRVGTFATFDIPLVSTSGIGVQQTCEFSEEYAGKGDKLDFDDESWPGLGRVRYT